MNTDTGTEELEQAIAAAELTEDEATHVRELVGEGGFTGPAIEHVLALRDEQPAAAEETQPADEQPAQPTKRQLAELDLELQRHRATVEEIMGSFVEGFDTCDTCGGAGITPGDPGPPTNELFRECPTCHGWAVVRTGSKDPSHVVRPCPGCGGRGYQELLDDAGAPVAPDQQTQPVAVPDVDQLLEQPAGSNGTEPPAEPRFGTPAWMGDPSVGS